MKLGILVYSHPENKAFTRAAMATELQQAAESLGHNTDILYAPFFTCLEKNVFYAGDNLDPYDVIITRPNYIEDTEPKIRLNNQLVQLGHRLINGEAKLKEIKNKAIQHQMLKDAGIPLPKLAIIESESDEESAMEEIGYPCVVKASRGTIGIGIFYAENRETLKPILDYLRIKGDMPIVLEKYVEEAGRKDHRAFVIGGEVVASYQRTAGPGDIRSNTGTGRKKEPVEFSEEAKKIAIEAAEVFELEYAGVDMIPSDDGPLVLEVNSNPGFTSISDVTGVNIAELLIEYAEKEGVKHKHEKRQYIDEPHPLEGAL